MTNAARACRALRVLREYWTEDTDYRSNIIDLLTDLRHLGDLIDQDINQCNVMAQAHYEHETETEGTE